MLTLSGLCIQTCMTIYPSIMYKKKQIASEGLCRAHLECVSELQGMWLYVETSINTKFCDMNGVLCDKCKKNDVTCVILKLNTKKQIYKQISYTHA